MRWIRNIARDVFGKKYLDWRSSYRNSPKGLKAVQCRFCKGCLDPKRINGVIDDRAPNASDEEKKALYDDIAACVRKYLLTPEEYFAYHFKGRTVEDREEFIPFFFRLRFLQNTNNWRKANIYDVKTNTAKVYAQFFKRKTVEVALPTDRDRLERFICEQKNVIIKPVNSSLGQGIQKFIVDEHPNLHEDVDAFIRSYYPVEAVNKTVVIAEDLVIQDERLAKLHPQSLNTMRVVTFRTDKETKIYQTVLRVGCGDSIVDNAGAGGLICLVDPQTGVVTGVANERGELFTVHPDTKEQLVGFQIPRFDELLETAKKMADVVPDCRYIGWDIALSNNNGWVLIEANYRPQHLSQFVVQKGCKQDFVDMAKELGFEMDFKP